jgi:hypothetical protein
MYATSVTAHRLPFVGATNVTIQWDQHVFELTAHVINTAPYAVLLGMDLLPKLGTLILSGTRHPSPLPLPPPPESDSHFATVTEMLVIPPRSELIFYAAVQRQENTQVLFEPSTDMIRKYDSQITPIVCEVRSNRIPIRILNTNVVPRTLPSGLRLGTTFKLSTPPDPPTPLPEQQRDTHCPPTTFPTDWTPAIDTENLTQAQQADLLRLLCDNSDIFAQDEYDLGHTDIVTHQIPLLNDTPIKQRPYRIPFQLREEGARQITNMLENGVIRRSTSPWCSPVVLVKKKDGSIRFCVDYRKLNMVTVKDVYPLPRIDEMLDRLGQTRYFSTMDLASGYWQIEVDEKEKSKTAFSTGQGLYEFNVLPFGLTGAPSTFQRIMDYILMDVPHAMVYIDDIIVYSVSFDQHLTDLRLVFKHIRAAGLKLKLKKCAWAKAQASFLGHQLSAAGIRPDPANIEKVKDFPRPRTVKHIQQFLGLASYYRRFIPGFAEKAAPLHSLVKKDQGFVWQEAQQAAFDWLKQKLIEPPIITFPDFRLGFILQTDASSQALGAILNQKDSDGREHVIAYASRTLRKHEKNYSATELELLAVVWSLKHFRHYVYGKPIELHTDHAPLKWLMSHKDTSSRLIRWAMQLQEYDLNINYKPGKQNTNADALSRIPQQAHCVCAIMRPLPLTDALREHQIEDAEIKIIYEYLHTKSIPASCPPPLRKHLYSNGDRYQFHQDLLHYRSPYGLAVVIPQPFRDQLILERHDGHFGGHLSAGKVIPKLRIRYHWRTLKKDVIKWCKTCQVCAARKPPHRYIKAPLQPLKVGGPFDRIAMDILGPLPLTQNGNKYILICIEYLTKYAEYLPSLTNEQRLWHAPMWKALSAATEPAANY